MGSVIHHGTYRDGKFYDAEGNEIPLIISKFPKSKDQEEPPKEKTRDDDPPPPPPLPVKRDKDQKRQPDPNAVYVDRKTGKRYKWNGSKFIEVK